MNNRDGSLGSPSQDQKIARSKAERCKNTQLDQDQVYHMRGQVKGEAERQAAVGPCVTLLECYLWWQMEAGPEEKIQIQVAVTTMWAREVVACTSVVKTEELEEYVNDRHVISCHIS